MKDFDYVHRKIYEYKSDKYLKKLEALLSQRNQKFYCKNSFIYI